MKVAPRLQGDRITLRQLQPSDYAPLREIMNDKITMEALIPFFGVDEWSDEMIVKRYEGFQNFQDLDRALSLIIELNLDRKVVGSCLLKNIDQTSGDAEFGIILDRSVWGQGLAREVHFLALSYAFEKIKLSLVYFETAESNANMRRFFDKYGFPFQLVTTENYYRYELPANEWPKVRALLAPGRS